jgi:hypothetical protein
MKFTTKSNTKTSVKATGKARKAAALTPEASAVEASHSTPSAAKVKTAPATTAPVTPVVPAGVKATPPPESIATRAYMLWEQAGRPQGRDLEYWLLAEAQLKSVAAH